MQRNKTIKDKPKTIKESILGLSQIKLSVFVFTVVLVAGTAVAGFKFFKDFRTEKKLATALEEVTPGQIPGWWYSEYFGASVCEADNCKDEADPDADKLTNYQEYYYSSNPLNRDTNANGLTDGEDVAFGYAPNKPGKVTFEQAQSDENIVGESLVFNTDVKDLIVDMTDLNKIVLPAVSDAELTITKENNKDGFTDYMLALDKVSKKYYKNDNQFAYLEQAIKQRNKPLLDQMVILSKQVAEDYRRVPVPEEALDLHKYQIALWRNLPTVLETPEPDATGGLLDNTTINKWYDSVQVMMSLNQKIAIEMQKLRTKYDQ